MIDLLHKDKTGDPQAGRTRARQRILRSTAALPSLVTLGNGILGFAAIHFATKPLPFTLYEQGQAAAAGWVGHNLMIAAWMLLGAMVCDALDGRLARMTRRTSDFGAQLDSLCDAISFGVAPAILMLRLMQSVLVPLVGEVGVDIYPEAPLLGKAMWVIAALYASCAILRLARFNVENVPDESAHMNFKGMPSPGAALPVISLVLLYEHLASATSGWKSTPWLEDIVIWAVPTVTLSAALLMVSRLRYRHLINQYIRGRKPFGYIVKLVMIVLVLAAFIDPQITLAVVATGYLFSGPVSWLWRRIHRRQQPQPQPPTPG